MKSNRSALGGPQALRDPSHLAMLPAAVGIGMELPFEIAGIDFRQPGRSGAVAAAVNPVAGEAGIGRPRRSAAQGDQFAGGRKSIGGCGVDRAAAGKDQGGEGDGPILLNSAWHFDSATSGREKRFPPGMQALLPLLALVAACKPPPEESRFMPIASAERGKAVIVRVGCASCHTITGIDWPRGQNGPALHAFAERGLIAGRLPNRPDVLAAYIRNAPGMVPGSAMPAMPVSEQEARDIAAFLYEAGSR